MRLWLTTLAAILLLCTPALAGSAYDIVPLDHWSYKVLEYWDEYDIVSDETQSSITADSDTLPLTRYQFAQFTAIAHDKLSDLTLLPDALLVETMCTEFGDQNTCHCLTTPHPEMLDVVLRNLENRSLQLAVNGQPDQYHWVYPVLNYLTNRGIVAPDTGLDFREQLVTGLQIGNLLAELDLNVLDDSSEAEKLLVDIIRQEFAKEVESVPLSGSTAKLNAVSVELSQPDGS
ncbi:MAG: hypothetical protein R3F46_12930 [bacterium]